jgi:MYXO-CTERM domain-containing protein
MSDHFPEIVGLSFAASVVLIFLFASDGAGPAIGLTGLGVAGLFLLRRKPRRKA